MSASSERSPILVTGVHRGGTTWVGKMLCASREAGYIFEPFNVHSAAGWLRDPLPYWYQYVGEENEGAYLAEFASMLRFRYPLARLGAARDLATLRTTTKQLALSLDYRRRGVRPLVKDPIAVFSTPWLARRFGATPVVLIRHPAAFVSSLLRLSWHFDFRNWTSQPLLMHHHLAPFADEIEEYATEPRSLVEQGALIWRAVYGTVRTFQRDHPEWIYVRHEDLAAEPLAGFAHLYQRLGLHFDERARDVVAQHSSGDLADVPVRGRNLVRRDTSAIGSIWHTRLSPDDISLVRTRCADVASSFYDDLTWEFPTSGVAPP